MPDTPDIDPELLKAGYAPPLRKAVRGAEKLKGVRPDLLEHWNNLQDEFSKAGITPTIKSGYRTAEQQHSLYTNPATHARTKGNDGYVNISPHQDRRALDIGFNSTQSAKGRQIIAGYARRNNLHVPSDEPWHIAIPKQSNQSQSIASQPSQSPEIDPELLQAGFQGESQSGLTKPTVIKPKQPPITDVLDKLTTDVKRGTAAIRPPTRQLIGDVRQSRNPYDVNKILSDARGHTREPTFGEDRIQRIRAASPPNLRMIEDQSMEEARQREQVRQDVIAERKRQKAEVSPKYGPMVGSPGLGNPEIASKMLESAVSPVQTVRNLFKSEDDLVQEETDRRVAAQQRMATPEMIAQRKEFGSVSAPVRALTAPAARAGAGLVKSIAGVTSGLGIAPNRLSDYLNHRGQVLEEASNAPLDEQGREIERGLPEKTVSALGDVGFGLAEIIALKKIAPNMSLSQILAVETALKTSDMPIAERADAVAKSALMGKVLDQHMSRLGSAAVFGVPTAVEQGAAYLKGNTSAEDALLQTGVQAGTGFLMGGGRNAETVLGQGVETQPATKATAAEAKPMDQVRAQEGPPTPPDAVLRDRAASPMSEPQRFQHVDFGEIEVLPDQSGAGRGKVRVAEVNDPTKQHFVKRSDMQGRGNARMIPIKESPTAEPRPADLIQPLEAAIPPAEMLQPEAVEAASPSQKLGNEAKTSQPSTQGAERQSAEPVVGFKTAKGSAYQVHDDGTTTRDKAARSEVGHEGQQGPQRPSQATYYVDSKAAQKLGEIQAQGGSRSLRGITTPDGERLAMVYDEGPSKGKAEGRTVVPFSRQPTVGATPVEIWNGGKGTNNVHFGNEIVELMEKPSTSDVSPALNAEQSPVVSPASSEPSVREGRHRVTSVKAGSLGKGIESNLAVEKAKAEIVKTGKVKPIEIDGDFIVDGEHRYKALLDLGVTDIPVYASKQFGSSGRLEKPYPGLSVDVTLPSPQVEAVTPSETKEITNEPAPKPSGVVADAPERKTGIARRVEDVRRAEFNQEPVTPSQGISAEDSVRHGRELLKEGRSPEDIVSEFKKNGAISADAMSVVRARHEELTREANKAFDEGRQNVSNPKFQAAEKARQDFWENSIRPMQTEWHKTGMAQQGETGIDSGTFYGLYRAFKERNGKEMSPEQVSTARNLSGKVAEADKAVQATSGALRDELDRAAGIKDLSPESQRAIQKFVDEAKRENRAQGRRTTRRSLDDEAVLIKQNIAAEFQRLKSQSSSSTLGSVPRGLARLDPEGVITKEVLRYAKNRAQAGITDAAQLVDDVHSALKDFSDVTRREVAEAISGYGLTSAEKLVGAFGQVRGELRKGLKAEDVARAAKQAEVDLRTRLSATKKTSPEDAKAIWERTKKYIDQGMGFSDARNAAGVDLGITPERVMRALTQQPKAKRLTNELYRQMSDRREAKAQAEAWVRTADTPAYRRFLGSLPDVFFGLKTFGHGTVGMITHAGKNIFLPTRWADYWPNFAKQYKLAYDRGYHEQMMQDLENRPNFITAKRAGLANDPSKTFDDYQKHSLARLFGRAGLVGARGFDSLKLLRQDLFDTAWNRLPDSLKTSDMAKLLATEMNHSTGVSDINLPKGSSTAFFAPKLEASRWAWVFGDNVKALKTLAEWKRSTPEERYHAKLVLKRSAEFMATYGALLAANQGLLIATGSKDRVNMTDPSKGDWMRFKIGGRAIEPTGGLIGMLDFLGKIGNAALGEQDPREGRFEKIGKAGASYLRGKLSPIASTATDVITGADFSGRPLPWSSDKEHEGRPKYTWPEYLLTQQTPIPVGEAARDVYTTMREKGAPDDFIKAILKGAAIGTLSGGTGVRIGEEYSARTDKAPHNLSGIDVNAPKIRPNETPEHFEGRRKRLDDVVGNALDKFQGTSEYKNLDEEEQKKALIKLIVATRETEQKQIDKEEGVRKRFRVSDPTQRVRRQIVRQATQ